MQMKVKTGIKAGADDLGIKMSRVVKDVSLTQKACDGKGCPSDPKIDKLKGSIQNQAKR